MAKTPKFSIIIPAQRIYDYLREHLKSYEKQTLQDFEIIILSDIEETDKFPKTRTINTGKVPPAKKRNIGAENARGEILAFIDDDAYPLENWLEIASKELENKGIVAIGGPSLVPKEATFFQRVSSKVYELSSEKTGIRYGVGKRTEIDDWPTCNLFVRKKEFLKVGGSDEKYWGGEDTQLCYSLLKTGKKIIYNPDMGIYHHPRTKLKSHLKQSYFWGMWRGFFMKIHPQSRQIVFFIPGIFVLWVLVGGLASIFNSHFKVLYIISIMFYLIYLLNVGFKSKSIKLFFPVILVSFLTQFVYGIGFCKGIFANKEIGPTKSGMHSFEKLKTGK